MVTICAPFGEAVRRGSSTESVLKCDTALIDNVLLACSGERDEGRPGKGTRGTPLTAVAALLMRIVGDPS